MNTNQPHEYVLTANSVDEEGKAIFGVPGPGSYRAATSFHASGVHSAAQTLRRAAGVAIPREFIEEELDDAGRWVYPTAPAYSVKGKSATGRLYISKLHAKAEAGWDSPGPRYRPTQADLPSSAKYTMGVRSAAGGALASQAHSPGPKYKLWENQAGPSMSFGTGKNHDLLHHKHMADVPGPGEYAQRGPSNETPAYSFASRNPEHERTRDRLHQTARVFISSDHAMRDFAGADTPGPGSYALASGPESRAYKFGKGANSPRKLFLGTEFLQGEDSSPGPAYDVGRSLAPGGGGLKFGKGKRHFSPELGGNAAGPLISRLHATVSQWGSASPGPGLYDLPSPSPQGVPKFATSTRKNTIFNRDMGPGPAAYYPAKLDGKHSNEPAFHMGTRLKVGGAFASRDEGVMCGPGSYHTIAPSRPESPVRKAIGTFGFAHNRNSFIPQNESPGPAHYFEDAADLGATSGSGRSLRASGASMTGPLSPRGKGGYTFGMTAPKAGTLYISSLHAASESYGKESPGPGTYDSPTPKTKGRGPVTFGKSARKTVIEEVAQLSQEASPGPAGCGAYSSFRSKGGKKGTFGTSVRPSLGKVSF